MQRYVARRLLMMPILVLGIVTVAFLISHLSRGDPLTAIVSEREMDNPEVVAAAKARWGLDKSLPEQYLTYIRNLLTGDLGVSFVTKRPVAQDIGERFPATLELVVWAMIIGGSGGILLGVLAAYYRDTPIDHGARLFALIGSSMPVFWVGLGLLYLTSVKLGILPGPGRLDARLTPPPFVTGMVTIDALLAGQFRTALDAAYHLILPAFVLGWTVTGIVSRLVRASMLDVLNQEYILTARAKGAGERRVLFHHALRNTLLPTLTVIGHSFAYLLTGAVLTETVFSWPGIGSYAVSAARSLDYPAIIGVTIVGGLAFLITNLVTDIAYAAANPKIRLS
ncbi:ABC transporter permease [Rhodoligotrophos defluvii]|uniref:ABC transporter permease n=1 Tax=Rhodoligotrophos defluvii TaxID=2561934 RepID=UPI0010C9BD3C|nr:ABC transporter permease [Rhodoligotrophos defluvii]